MTEKPDLLQLIRDAMKPTKPSEPPNRGGGEGIKRVQVTKTNNEMKVTKTSKTQTQPRLDEHGLLGDFSRSNSNPISRTVNTTAPVGLLDTSGAGDESVLSVIRIAIDKLAIPSKRQVKHMASPKMTNPSRVFDQNKGCGPGSSKSGVIDAMKAIAATETGCLTREQMKGQPISLSQSQKNSNTTQGNYNPMIVR